MPLSRKHTQNVIIDFISFVCMALLIVTGFLLQWKLPHGSKDSTVLSYTRHQWGEFHFWIALIFIAGIITHLLLHIPWIKSVLNPQKGTKQRNTFLIISFAVYVLIMIALGVFASPVLK